MTDPLTSSATEGGLDANDTLDWKDSKTPAANATRMFIWFTLPLIAMLAITLAAFGWKISHKTLPVTVASAPAASDKDTQIAQLQAQIQRLQGQPANGPVTTPGVVTGPALAPAPVYSADAAAIAQMSARLDRLETNQRALARAAAAASAASTLQQKAHTSDPFLAELAAVEPAFDDPALTAPLRAVAEKGVPSEVQLAIDFPHAAARANIASKADSDEDSLFNRARHALGSFISVRRTDNLNGNGAQAILLRAETRLNMGDLDGALAYLNTLSPSAKTALKPWLDRAHARALVDDTTRHITQVTLQRLVQANDGAQATAPAVATGGVL